jgi:hypothetical protein
VSVSSLIKYFSTSLWIFPPRLYNRFSHFYILPLICLTKSHFRQSLMIFISKFFFFHSFHLFPFMHCISLFIFEAHLSCFKIKILNKKKSSKYIKSITWFCVRACICVCVRFCTCVCVFYAQKKITIFHIQSEFLRNFTQFQSIARMIKAFPSKFWSQLKMIINQFWDFSLFPHFLGARTQQNLFHCFYVALIHARE